MNGKISWTYDKNGEPRMWLTKYFNGSNCSLEAIEVLERKLRDKNIKSIRIDGRLGKKFDEKFNFPLDGRGYTKYQINCK